MTKSLTPGALTLFILYFNFGIKYTDVDLSRSIIDCYPATKNIGIDSLEQIHTNDNRTPAGKLLNGVLHLDLEVRTGKWYPESNEGLPIKVHAFAETGKPMQLPGPLIRVPEGTEIIATVRNLITDAPLILYGFHSRPGIEEDSVVIPYGKSYKAKFRTDACGTYLYRATAGNRQIDGLPYYTDSQLYGAFIIDSRDDKPDINERIFVIGIWNDTLTPPNTLSNEELVLNGLSWPFTERLTYTQNQPVNWRVINASNQVHPMHLHGFYFTVNSKGNAARDVIYEKRDRRRGVTELLRPHETMTMTWLPEKAGNWLFHCHTLVHIMPFSFLRKMAEMNEQHMNDVATHAHSGMGGLIMGIHVLPAPGTVTVENSKRERSLTLTARENSNRFGKLPGKGFVLSEKNSVRDTETVSIPGPLIVLNRNQPVNINIVNKLSEATTVHWHGLEIESYFDGAAGWGNNREKLAPLVLPGSSFTARLIPPRAGTFIYHTHMHNEQLVEGMYGPLIVLEPGEKFNKETDKILLISSAPPLEPPVAMLNGTLKTETMQLKVGRMYRFRLINITALNPDIVVNFLSQGSPVMWRPMAKDGANLPVGQMKMIPAAAQAITIGETRDFQFQPNKAGNYIFEVRDVFENHLYVTLVLKAK